MILLPVLFILAIIFTPRYLNQELIPLNLPKAYPKIVKEIDKESYKINIRSKADSLFQLELFLKEPISLPAAVIYYKERSDSKDLLLGNAGREGLYRFYIPDTNAIGIYFKSTIGNYPEIHIKFN